jgi:hypothetical protein
VPIKTTIRVWRATVAATWTNLKVIFEREPWWAEWWSAVVVSCYTAASVFAPSEVDARPAFEVLYEVGTPFFWEVTGLILGISQMVALLADWRRMRWGMAIFLCIWWGVHSVAVYSADPHARIVIFYLAFTGINLFSILRLLKRYD